MAFAAGSDHGPAIQAALGVMTGAIAFDAHAVKASTRLAINTSPEPVSNIVASVAEDSMVIMMFYFFIKHPWMTLTLIILFLVGSFFVIRFLWRFFIGIFRKPKPKAVVGTGEAIP